MPIVRYEIRNEYGLGDPALYGAADKGDPEALLEGVAMAGLVGLLRQLGDLTEFAAEIFHDLHEEVMATSARGHGLLLRVQQLEVEFPSIEKGLCNQKELPRLSDNHGVDWHPNLRIDQNLVTREDMPRFILDCYEESRGPPRLFMLDKFDSAEDGACLKRYSDPSFFKTNFVSAGNVEGDYHSDSNFHRNKKNIPRWKNGVASEVEQPLFVENNSEHLSAERPDKQSEQVKRVKLKKRQLNDGMDIGRSYLERILDTSIEKFLKHSQEDVRAVKPVESLPEECDSIYGTPNVGLNFKEKGMHTFQAAGQNRDIENFIGSDENLRKKNQEQVPKNSLLVTDSYQQVSVSSDGKSSSSLNDYRTDDIGSELENYLDALATMESEVETDAETKSKLRQITFLKEYPKFRSNEAREHLSEQIFYSGDDNFPNKEVSNGSCEKSLEFHDSLPSQFASEEPPFNIMDQDGAGTTDHQIISTISSNNFSEKGIVENQMKHSDQAAQVLNSVIEETKLTPTDANLLSGGEESGEISDSCSDHEKKHQAGSENMKSVMNLRPSVPIEDQKPNEEMEEEGGEISDAYTDHERKHQDGSENLKSVMKSRPSVLIEDHKHSDDLEQRLRDPIILANSMKENQPVPPHDWKSQVIHNENSVIKSSNTDLDRASLISDVESTSSSLPADKGSQLAFLKVGNHEERLGSSYLEPRADFVESSSSQEKSAPIESVVDKSSIDLALGLDRYGSLMCSEILDESYKNDVSCAKSSESIESLTVVSGKSFEESFVTGTENATATDLVSKSNEPTVSDANASLEEHSFEVSDLNSGDPCALAEKNMSPSNGNKPIVSLQHSETSLNHFLLTEYGPEVFGGRSSETFNFESTSNHQGKMRDCKGQKDNSSKLSSESPSGPSETLPSVKSSALEEVSTFRSLQGSSEAGEKSMNDTVHLSDELDLSKTPNSPLKLNINHSEPSQLLPLDEDPPPPPLPPIQWRMGKLRPSFSPLMEGMTSTFSPSSVHSYEQQKIEMHQEHLSNGINECSSSLQQPSVLPNSVYPETSNPFPPPRSSRAEGISKEKSIEGYFSDTSLSRDNFPRNPLQYQGFYMYASEDEHFLREEYQSPVRRPSSLLNRPRDPLIEAVAAHDRSTLRRVSEMPRSSPKTKDETNDALLEQIRNKSFTLKPAAAVKPIMKAPPTNLKVAAILEKASAIRQAVAGSDEDDDNDSWSDS